MPYGIGPPIDNGGASPNLLLVTQLQRPLLPSELLKFFFGANELHGAVVKEDAAAFRVVMVERE